jgi:DNA-binding response OmpR family regulator
LVFTLNRAAYILQTIRGDLQIAVSAKLLLRKTGVKMKKQVVIIEDDEAINDILSIMLENSGYAVSSVRGVDSLDTLYLFNASLFLIDRNLPGIDGITLCRQLKASPKTKTIPVIIISASTGFVELAISAGADACIEKPFSRKELFTTIDQQIRRADLQSD